MDDELRGAFATLSGQLESVSRDAREASARAGEAAYAVNRVDAKVSDLGRKVNLLEHAVYGSNPPPAPPPLPLTARITEGEGSVAELTGVVLALKGELAEHRKASEEYRAKTDAKLDNQTAILLRISGAVTGVVSHPLAKKVGWMAAGVAALWLASVQSRLEAKTEKIDHDVAKVVASQDGGAK